MNRRTILITGTSSGMGLHAAVELARRGHDVVATVRSKNRAGALLEAAEAAGAELDVRELEVTDHAVGAALVEEIVRDHGRLDVLINNAGRGSVATAEQLSLEDVQAQLDVNYLAPVALTKAVLPRFREQGSGTVLTVTSVGGVVGQPFAEAYCGAKFAVEGFMQSLAPLAERFGVRVSVIEPAAVTSDFVSNVSRAAAEGPYGPMLDAYMARAEKSFAAAQSAESAGLVIADAATSEEYRFRWQTSASAEGFAGLSLRDLDGEAVLAQTRTWIG